MKDQAVHPMTAQEHFALSTLTGLVGSGQIWKWIMQYGVPLIMQALPIIMQVIAAIQGGAAISPVQLMTWISELLAALEGGKPAPPAPVAALTA